MAKITQVKHYDKDGNLIDYQIDTRAYEYEYPWDYVENEGPNCTRYDWAGGSMWLYLDNSIDGQIPAENLPGLDAHSWI